jgi:hypothetical protein
MRRWLVFLFIVHFSYGLTAETVQVTAFGYTLDLPPGWEVLDAQDPQLVSFTDSFHRAVFQIAVFPAEAFRSVSEILSFVKDKFKAQGDEAPFLYNGSNAVLADFTFRLEHIGPGGIRCRNSGNLLQLSSHDLHS